MMQSNHLFITISMLAHMWEQQIIKFILMMSHILCKGKRDYASNTRFHYTITQHKILYILSKPF